MPGDREDAEKRQCLAAIAVVVLSAGAAVAQDGERPNILMIMGDEIGWYNPSAYNMGMMGYRTPNIDRIAAEPVLRNNACGQQRRKVGRAAFLGQTPRKAPMIVDLRADPFEMAPEDSSYCDDWVLRHMHVIMPLVELVGEHMATFEDFPPRQASGSFTPKQ